MTYTIVELAKLRTKFNTEAEDLIKLYPYDKQRSRLLSSLILIAERIYSKEKTGTEKLKAIIDFIKSKVSGQTLDVAKLTEEIEEILLVLRDKLRPKSIGQKLLMLLFKCFWKPSTM